jgi:two-component system chemotaxis response regulator CheB
VVIGASAGGLTALLVCMSALPADFGATVLVDMHIPPAHTSDLPRILSRAGSLPARSAYDGQPLDPGRVLVAPPGRHLTVGSSTAILSTVVEGTGVRPSVDMLFRSAATNHGPRVVAVVLSGALTDGAAGMSAVTRRGGIGVVQDPEEAPLTGMPRSALATGGAQFALSAAQIPNLVCALVAGDDRSVERVTASG